MRPRRFFSAMFLGLTAALPAAADDVEAGGRVLRIEPMGGFCALDRRNEIDARILGLMEDIQRDYNKLLAYWATCKDLADVHGGSGDDLTPYVLILAQISNGAVARADLPLADYLALMNQELAKSNNGKDLLAGSEALVRKRFDEALAKLNADGQNLSIGETRLVGALGQDEIALYLGLIQRQSVNAREYLLGGAVAMTELGGISVSVNYYDYYDDVATFDTLRARTHDIVADLVAANPTMP